MAVSPNVQAARIKLHELQRQRDRLDEHYAAVERRAAAAGTPLERLRVLFDGLREATFARKPLHPEVANLDALFLQGRLGVAPPDLVAAWQQRLEREIDRGRLRAEFAHAFGLVLAETPPAAPASSADPRLLFADTAEERETFDLAFLDCLFDACDARGLEGLRGAVRAFADGNAGAAATDEEAQAVLTLLRRDPTRTPELRRQAARAADSTTQVHEYAGVLTILLANLPAWDWPAEGVPRRLLSLRDKPRLFLEDDLLTAMLLQLVGLRWGMKLKGLRRELLKAAGSAFWPPEAEGYNDDSVVRARALMGERLFLPMMPGSLRELTRKGGYAGNEMEEQLRCLLTEIRFRRAAFPDRPLHVVRIDLRDYYPRVPHPVLLRLLERLGLPDVWRDFLAHYLRVRVRTGDDVRVVRRGVPLDHRLGDALAEWLLLLLDVFVEREAGVQTIRLVDDVFYVTDDADQARRAWQAVQRFCAACGLEVNAEKSGATTLGGPTPDGLPPGAVCWGTLVLEGEGGWRIHEPTLARLRDWTRRQVEAGGTTLGMVRAHNDAVRFLCGVLGLGVELGPGHLDEVGRRLAELQQNLFGPGRGIAAELQARLGRQVRDSRLQQRGLPDALLYWPVTAGGLGLVQPLLLVAAHAKAREGATTPGPPPAKPPAGTGDWLRSETWAEFRDGLHVKHEPAAPEATPGLQALVQDFIARGGEVAGRKQAGLNPYWQWVLYTYGPPLLDALGTFRFLLTELVPLGLVFDRGGQEEDMSESGEDIPF
jgi:hypothetical protein